MTIPAHTDFYAQADEFRGKRVLVTGGTKGMGEAIVRRMLRGGATVISTARSKPAVQDAVEGADSSRPT